MEVSMLC